MKRAELLKSREFWINEIQNDLYVVMEKYMKENKINRTELAAELSVSKGYITQVLKGDFDHKISKFVDLSLACNVLPIINFIDANEYIRQDAKDITYMLVPVNRIKNITYDPAPVAKEYTRDYLATGSILLSSFSSTSSFTQ